MFRRIGIGIAALLAGGVFLPQTVNAQEFRIMTADPSGRTLSFGSPVAGMNAKPMLVNSPVSAMIPYFGLTDEQAQKIAEIQKNARLDFRTMFADAVKMTDQDGNTVTSPDGAKIRSFRISVDGEKMKEMQSKMQERQARLQEDQERAEKEIELVLTPAQRPPINSFLRDLELFRGALLPPELIKELDLNGPQKRKLQNIVMKAKNDREQRVQGAMAQARQSGQYTSLGSSIGSSYTDWQKEVREKSRAVLTTEQRAILEKWEKERPASSYGLPSGGPVVRLGG